MDRAIEALDTAIAEIAKTDPEKLPPPDAEILEVFRDRLEELRDLSNRIVLTGNKSVADDLRGQQERKAKITGMTVLRYGYRAAEFAAVFYSAAGGIKEFHPETYAALRELFQDIPWPF